MSTRSTTAAPTVLDIAYTAPSIATHRFRFHDLFLVPNSDGSTFVVDSPLRSPSPLPSATQQAHSTTTGRSGGKGSGSGTATSTTTTTNTTSTGTVAAAGTLRYVTQDGRCPSCNMTSTSAVFCKHCARCPRCESICAPRVNTQMQVWLLCEFCQWRTARYPDLQSLSDAMMMGKSSSSSSSKDVVNVTQRCAGSGTAMPAAVSSPTTAVRTPLTQEEPLSSSAAAAGGGKGKGDDGSHAQQISFSRRVLARRLAKEPDLPLPDDIASEIQRNMMLGMKLDGTDTTTAPAATAHHLDPDSGMASAAAVAVAHSAVKFDAQVRAETRAQQSKSSTRTLKLWTSQTANEFLAKVSQQHPRTEASIVREPHRQDRNDVSALQLTLGKSALLHLPCQSFATPSGEEDTTAAANHPSRTTKVTLIKRQAVVWTAAAPVGGGTATSSASPTSTSTTTTTASVVLSSGFPTRNTNSWTQRPEVVLLQDMQRAARHGAVLNLTEIVPSDAAAATASSKGGAGDTTNAPQEEGSEEGAGKTRSASPDRTAASSSTAPTTTTTAISPLELHCSWKANASIRKKCCHAMLYLPVLTAPANMTTTTTAVAAEDSVSSTTAQSRTAFLQWQMLSEQSAVVVGIKLGRIVAAINQQSQTTTSIRNVTASFGSSNTNRGENQPQRKAMENDDEDDGWAGWARGRVTVTGVSGLGKRPERHYTVDNATAAKLRATYPSAEQLRDDDDGKGEGVADGGGAEVVNEKDRRSHHHHHTPSTVISGLLVDGGTTLTTTTTSSSTASSSSHSTKGQRLLFALHWEEHLHPHDHTSDADTAAAVTTTTSGRRSVAFHVQIQLRVELSPQQQQQQQGGGGVPPVFPNFAPPAAPHIVEYSAWVTI